MLAAWLAAGYSADAFSAHEQARAKEKDEEVREHAAAQQRFGQLDLKNSWIWNPKPADDTAACFTARCGAETARKAMCDFWRRTANEKGKLGCK